MKDKKLGFGGQWVEIFRAGTHPDSEGVKRALDASFLERVVQNFKPDVQEVPITAGSPIHPPDDAPAFGLTTQVRLEGDSLLAQFSDVDPELEDLVKTKKLVSRSASFYLDPPRLKHVHFLGVQPSAVKSLKRIHFSEGTTVDVQVDTAITFSEGDNAVTEQEKKTLKEEAEKGIVKRITDALGITKPEGASFSEGDRKKLIDDAVAAAKAEFFEELKKANDKVDEIQKAIDAQTGNSNRGAVVSFCDSMIKAGKLTPAVRTRVVNLMDELAALPADKKVTVISFAENGDEQKTDNTLLVEFQEFVKALPVFIQFGEGFSSLKANGDGSEIVAQKQKDTMREAMGLKSKENN